MSDTRGWRAHIERSNESFIRGQVGLRLVCERAPFVFEYDMVTDSGTILRYRVDTSNGPVQDAPDPFVYQIDEGAARALYEALTLFFGDEEARDYKRLREDNIWLKDQLDRALEWQRNMIKPKPKEQP